MVTAPTFIPSATLMSLGASSLPTKPNPTSAHPAHMHIDRIQRFFCDNIQKQTNELNSKSSEQKVNRNRSQGTTLKTLKKLSEKSASKAI